MPEELDPALAEDLVGGAMVFLQLTHSNKVLCTKRQLQECMLRLARDAYALVSSRGRKSSSTCPAQGSAPPGWTFTWMIHETWPNTTYAYDQ